MNKDEIIFISSMVEIMFLYECIASRVFNRLSIKRPELSIPGFNDIFARELGRWLAFQLALFLGLRRLIVVQPAAFCSFFFTLIVRETL